MVKKGLVKAYQELINFGSNFKSMLLLICRLYWGGLFMLAGWGKLINIEHFVDLLTSYQFPYPHFFAYLAASTEFVGGICLILGFASRLAAIPLMATMLTAYATVHYASLASLFTNPTEFVAQTPFNFLLITLLILAFGPGRFSIDYLIEKCFCCKKE